MPFRIRILLLLTICLHATAAHSASIRLQDTRIDTTEARREFILTGRHESKLERELQQTIGSRQTDNLQPYLIQFSGPVSEKEKFALIKAGLIVVGYVPDNALLVRGKVTAIQRALSIEAVTWVGDYRGRYRIHREISELARRNASQGNTQALSRAKSFTAPEAISNHTQKSRVSDYPDAPGYEEPKMLTIVLFEDADCAAIAALVEQRGGAVVTSSATRSGGQLRVRLATTAAAALADQPAVRWIEPYREPKLMNNVAVQEPRMNVQTVWTNFALTGSNQIIAVCDTGLDNGNTNTIHPDFSNKIHRAIARARVNDWSDSQGHGTHVSGSVLGSGKAYSNGLYKGIAYDAKLVFQSIMDDLGYLSGLPEDLNDLFLEAYTNDARIHSDSWGSAVDGAYTVDARQADEFLWNHQDMLIVFAAGNEGADSLPTGDPDGVVDEDSLSAPGTAKNVLTVGAAESARTNGGYSTSRWNIFGYYSDPLSNDFISASYDGTNQGMAAFSSRGPCNDGRTKPDIVAPGTDIISCRSRGGISGNAWGAVDGTTNYMYSGGTSMATPLTAGAAGLVRQYLVERRGITNPPGALIKAMMLNGARSLAPGQYGTGAWREIPDRARPNNVEGWGHVNLGETLQPPAGRTNALYTGQVATGQTNTYAFVSTNTNTLSIVLAWHDYPGEFAAAQMLVNDLDLRVIVPGGQVHLGNGVVGGDRINNVEGLDIFPLTPGTTVVQVIGFNVPQGTDQPYALVIREAPGTYSFKLQRATHNPEWPTNNQSIALQTFVQAGVGGIGGATNFYRINTGTWVAAAAVPVSGYGPGIVYEYALGGYPTGTRVDYYAVAYDSAGSPQTSATNSFYVADLVAYVKTNGTPVPPYNTWATAATNINDAVTAVIPGGIVWVTNGVYDGGVVIRKSCTVKSVNGAATTTIDGRGSNRCVKMDGVVYSVLDGFTLTNGVSPNGEVLGDKAGGGVLLREYAMVQNCVISGNRAQYGGGAACYNSKFRYEAGTISNCVIEGNYADTYYGGGVRLAYGGYLTHSIIRNNKGESTAGGVYYEGLGGYMENCLIVGNVATSGYATGGGVEFYGGGTMANCTVVSNTASLRGGVNFIYISKMVNSIVWSNRQASGLDADDENGHANIIRRSDYSCAAGLSNSATAGFGNTTNHPRFADFSAGNYRLTPNSPCRDTGVNGFWDELYNEYQYHSMDGKIDLDGTARIKNAIVDMGAYELLYTDTNAPLVTLLSPSENSIGVDPATTLVLTFDENVYRGPGSIRLYRGDGTLSQSFAATDAVVGVAGAMATVTPTNALTYTNAYYVLVDTNAFRDASTNWFAGISSTNGWNFTTRDAGNYVTNTLRIDFGTNVTAEADGGWQPFVVGFSFTGTSTSQLFSLDSGSATVTVRSSSTLTGRDRNAPTDSGALTYADMYRDLVQISSGGLTAVVAGVQASAQINLRLWAYDYSFADGVTFTIRDVTDGRNNVLGSILNATGAAARPTNNTMYSVAADMTAGTNGTLILQITGDSGPARLNALELNVMKEVGVVTSTLTIASTYGMASPPVGVQGYVSGSSVTCSITNSPIIEGTTQFVCTGWSGTGSAPTSGSETSVTFTITNNSSVIWLWTTNVESLVVSNLAVDSTFDPSVGDRIVGMDVDPQGRTMIVGSFTNIGAVHRQQIARLLSNGALDTNLTIGAAYGDHDWALSVLCHSNGQSYVGGTMNGVLKNFARYNADGSHDTNFPGPGISDAADNAVEMMLQLADGGLLVGGKFTYAMDEEHGGLARFNATSGIVSAFTTTLDNFDGGWNSVYALAQQADGKLLIGGDFFTINGTNRYNLGRIGLDGALDTTFTNALTGTSARVNCLLVQTNGLLAGGYFSRANGQPVTNLARFTSADALDTGFTVYPNGRVNALLALPDGRTLIGGDFTMVNGGSHPGLAMLKNDLTLDDTFTIGIAGDVAAAVYALHLDHDNGVLVAGEFNNLGGVARQNIGRLMLGPSTNTPPSTNTTAVAEYWAGINQDGHARNASAVTLDGDLRIRWARALTNFNDALLQARTNYAGQRGNGLAIRDGRILALVPNATNPLSQASGQYFASFGTFSLANGTKLHETITPHVGAGTRGAAALQDSDTTYGYVNFYWNREDTVFTGYGADIGRSYAFDAYSGTLAPYTPFSRMAESPNGSGYFSMTYDNPRMYARGALNTHASFSKARAGVLGQGELQIEAMKHYNSYLVGGWDVFGFTMTQYTDDSCFPVGLGTKITNYRFTNSPYGVTTNWTASMPSNTFAGFGLHHVRGAPRPLALGTDGRIYYYGFRNTMSGSTPTAADYASGMRLFAVSAANGQPLFEINTGWNPDGDEGLVSTAAWGTQRYHYFLPQIAVLSNRVVVFHPQVNQGHSTNLWTRGRLFCFDLATTSLAWSVAYSNNSFIAKLCMDDVVYNAANNTSPNCMWGDNTEQAVQLTIAGDHAYVVDPGIQGGGASGPLQLTIYRHALASGVVTATNLIPTDANTNTITAYAERMVNNNDNTNCVALREIAAVDGALVALVDVDLKAQALVVIEGSASVTNNYAPAAAISAPYAGIPPAVQTFNDHRLTSAAKTNIAPVLNRLGAPMMKVYDTGSAIPFDATGSTDPDGGSLVYAWNYGDGATGAGALTSHVYASWGGAPAVSNFTVRLTVTDNEGNTNTTTRSIWVRDVGSSAVTTLTASADAYIYTAGSNSNSNYGTAQTLQARRVDHAGVTQQIAYIKFDLTGVDVTAVTDAVLRVYVTVPKDFLLETHAVSNGWTETGLRGTNAPPLGAKLGDASAAQYDAIGTWSRAFHQWIEIPVLAHVKDMNYGTERSFALVATNASTAALEIASRNNTTWSNNAPQLVLRTGKPGYGGPIITSAPPATIVYTDTTTQTLSVAASSAIGAANLTYSWRQVSGPARATLSSLHALGSGATTVAIPPGGGTYVFRCMVDDGLLYNEVEVTFQETAEVTFAMTVTVNNLSWGSVSPTGGVYTSGTVVQVTAIASNGFSLANWTGAATGSANPLALTMDGNKSVTANFVTNVPPATTTNSLTVISAHGAPSPSGTSFYTNGSLLSMAVGGSPVDQGTTQLVATGWSLAGNSPVSGSATNFSLTLTNNATLTWLWQTNIQFTRSAGAGGSVAGATNGWYALGGGVTVTAAPNSGYSFAGWSGDVDAGSTNSNPLTLTLDRARSITANFASNAAPSGAGLIWRVDFNGAANDTLATSNFTGWTVSATSRTQTFANVVGGSISSSITVRLLGTGTFNAYERVMNLGAFTNLYRDGAQTTASLMTMAISNLSPGVSYQLRLWYFDDEFSIGGTQTYVNVTDGGSVTLGALTNTYTANAASGHASLPSELYDTRYCLTASVTAGTNGTLTVSITPNAGNTKLNAFELVAPGDGSGSSVVTNTLMISSVYGMTSPSGTLPYTNGSSVSCFITNTPFLLNATTQLLVVGWTGSGSVPASGTGTSVTFVITNDSTISWQWETNHLLSATTGEHGQISTTGGWYRSYSNASITATGDTYYHLAGWTGDVSSSDNPLSLSMNTPKTVGAWFAEDLYTNGVPATWLAGYNLPVSDAGALSDTDFDGMSAWEEHIADTIPTNYASRLILNDIRWQTAGSLLSWDSKSGRLYSIYVATNLLTGLTWPLVGETTGGSLTDSHHSAEAAVFYQIKVRLQE